MRRSIFFARELARVKHVRDSTGKALQLSRVLQHSSKVERILSHSRNVFVKFSAREKLSVLETALYKVDPIRKLYSGITNWHTIRARILEIPIRSYLFIEKRTVTSTLSTTIPTKSRRDKKTKVYIYNARKRLRGVCSKNRALYSPRWIKIARGENFKITIAT